MDFGEVQKMLFVKELLDDLHGLRADLYDLSRDGEFHRYFTYENVPMINRKYERLLKMKKMLDEFDSKKKSNSLPKNYNRDPVNLDKERKNSNSKDLQKLLDEFNSDFSKIINIEHVNLLNEYVKDVESKRLLPIVDSNVEVTGYLVNLSMLSKKEISESKFLQSYMKELEDGTITKVEYYRRG